MSKQKKRIYFSEARQAQAAETRARILDSAKKLFQKEGFELVTIQRLANEADVSQPTIYALFQSKRGVLRAILDEALPKEQFETLVKEVMREKSAKKRLIITGN